MKSIFSDVLLRPLFPCWFPDCSVHEYQCDVKITYYYCITLDTSLYVCQYLFSIFRCPMLGAKIVSRVISTCWIGLVIYVKCPFVYCYSLFFKSILSYVSIATQISSHLHVTSHSITLLSFCVYLLIWSGSLVVSISTSLFIQLHYAFCLEHLVHLN